MKYHILHDFRTSDPYKEKSSDRFKDLHKLKFLANFDVSLISSPGVVMNQACNTLFITPPGDKSD